MEGRAWGAVEVGVGGKARQFSEFGEQSWGQRLDLEAKAGGVGAEGGVLPR